MYITWQTVITTGAVITALGVILGLFIKVVRFIDRQKKQDTELVAMQAKHERDMSEIKREEREHIAEMKQEQTLLVYGVLACLKGLKEQGCNGPVTEAISNIERHINQKAHE